MPVPRPGWRADGSRSAIALTFDTDDALGYTSAILDTLEQYDVHASFAVTGLWAQAHPALLQRIVRDGDTVMNHSWDHPDFTKITTQQRLLELQRTDDAVRAAAGISTKPYFRPPYGALDDAVRTDAAQAGYLIVRWNIDPKGWSGKSGLEVQANVYQNARDSGIVLFHVFAAGDYAGLGPIIRTLGDAGYRFVTVAELYPPPPSPTPTLTPPPTATPSATATPTTYVPSPTPSLAPGPPRHGAPATATPSPHGP
jgi:peptidoglycan/xylan/chitin deacetylase (PgdA/CDA1 family)